MARRLPLLTIAFALLLTGWLLVDAVPWGSPSAGVDPHATVQGRARTGAIDEVDPAARPLRLEGGMATQRGRVRGEEAVPGTSRGADASPRPSSTASVPFGGVVMDPEGRPAAGAGVRLLPPSRGEVVLTAGGDGRFEARVPAGRLALLIVHPTGSLLLARQLVDGATGTQNRFDLRRQVRLTVRLTGDLPARDVAPTLALVPDELPASESLLVPFVAGEASIEGVHVGWWTLRIEGLADAPLSRRIDLRKDQVVSVAVPAGVTLRGKVEDAADGRTVAGAQVAVHLAVGSGLGARLQTTTAGDGRFEMQVPRGAVRETSVVAEGYAPWPHALSTPARREQTRALARISQGEDVEVLVRLERGATVSGRVRDAEGHPVDALVVGFEARRTPRLEATSGADGAYRLSGLVPGRYAVLVRAEGWAVQGSPTLTVAARDGTSSQVLDVTVQRLASLGGRVVRADGGPAAGARVWAAPRGRDRGTVEAFSGSDGGFHLAGLPAGTGVTLRAALGSLEATPVRVRPGEARADALRLVLEATGRIEGRVVDLQTGEAIRDAVVRLGAGGPPEGRGGATTRSGRDGHFRFERLIPGPWVLRASREGWLEGPAEPVSLPPGQEAVEAALRLDPGLLIGGRVEDPTRAPVRGASVLVAGTNRQGRRVNRSTRTDDRGSFRVAGLEPGEYAVLARRAGHAPARLTHLGGGEDRLLLVLVPNP